MGDEGLAELLPPSLTDVAEIGGIDQRAARGIERADELRIIIVIS